MDTDDNGIFNPALQQLNDWCAKHYSSGEPVIMICPFCASDIQEMWQPLWRTNDENGTPLRQSKREIENVSRCETRKYAYTKLRIYWMRCQACGEIIARVHKIVAYASRANASEEHVDEQPKNEVFWFAVPPRRAAPLVSDLVPPEMARDYREAYYILDSSPRLAAVLARRILADLLKQYAGLDHYNLSHRIDKFVKDKNHPARHRDNLHYLREIGDWTAHTLTDTEGKILEATEEEVSWTLKVIGDLFDYFIVGPQTDKRMRAALDGKLDGAGRKPIRKLKDSEDEE